MSGRDVTHFNVLLIINVIEINSYRQEYYLPCGFNAFIREGDGKVSGWEGATYA